MEERDNDDGGGAGGGDGQCSGQPSAGKEQQQGPRVQHLGVRHQ